MSADRKPWIVDPLDVLSVRSSAEELSEQARLIAGLPFVPQFLDAMPNFVSVLNQNRQVVYANRALRNALGIKPEDTLPDVRMGEALSCRFAFSGGSGCGDSEYCTMCGANHAIRSSLEGDFCVKECTVSVKTLDGASSLDFLVQTQRISIADQDFVIFSAVDLENKKRRRSLEHVFFKDVLTLASGVRGIALTMNEQPPSGLEHITETLYLASKDLVDEIEAQRDLLAAEAGDLRQDPKDMRTLWFLEKTVNFFVRSSLAEGKNLLIDPDTLDVPFRSDPEILRRAVGNLVKNALENTAPGESVLLGCRDNGDFLEFWIKNKAVMSEEVRLQIFKRFFTTKGKSTGLGTYGSQIMVENYLGGEIYFSSEPDQGTEFRIRLPHTI